jgi:hypothetical protein
MQKRKFCITCPDTLFVESVPVPHEHGRHYVIVSQPKHTGTHYVTHRSDQMQKHKFGTTSPNECFVESIPGLPEHEK